MNTRQRLTVLAGLVVAIMLTPAVALAQEAPTLAELISQTASATAEYSQAQAHVTDLDTRLFEARTRLEKVESALPSNPGENVKAAATAMGGAFSPSLARRADRTVGDLRERDQLQSQIKKLQKEREQAVADADKAKEKADALQFERDKAQKVASAEAAVAIEAGRAAHAQAIRLMVDPGHGGHDPGAVGNGLLEKDTNLAIAYKVVAAAQRQGWNVGLTRDGDYFVPLDQRPAAAAAWGATAFVSIHSNSGGDAPHGNMTIYRTPDGAVLGQKIMQQIDPLTGYGDIGNSPDVRGLAVLRGAKMSATLVEILSVSSPVEAQDLGNADAQTAYAEAIVRGVADFHGIAYVPPAPAQPAAAAAATVPAAPAAEKVPASAETTAAPADKTDAPAPHENKLLEQLLLFLSR